MDSRIPSAATSRLTPATLRELAARHGIRPRKSLGQHFLIEPALARRIVELADVRPHDRVVEAGVSRGPAVQGVPTATPEGRRQTWLPRPSRW